MYSLFAHAGEQHSNPAEATTRSTNILMVGLVTIIMLTITALALRQLAKRETDKAPRENEES